MFKAAKVDTLAVNHTVGQLFRQSLFGFLDSTKTVIYRLEKQLSPKVVCLFFHWPGWSVLINSKGLQTL